MLAKYRPLNLIPLLSVLVSSLSAAVASVPLSVALQSEQTLSELAQHDALRTIDFLLSYLSNSSGASRSDNGDANSSSSSQLVLFALNVITSAVKYVSHPQLQHILPMLLPPCVSLLSGPVVELRQGAVFLMVQLYASVGDSLLSHSALSPLSHSQKSLLAVYINRQQKSS